MTIDAWSEGFRTRLEQLVEIYGSKAEMARRAGLPARTLENYFKGHKPSPQALIALSQGLGADVDWLLGLEPVFGDVGGDLLQDAVISVLHPFLRDLLAAAERGETPVASGRIMGKSPHRCAVELSSQVRAAFYETRLRDAQDLGSSSPVPSSQAKVPEER